MSKFKIGDKVRCVRSYKDHVIEGCVYTVLDVTGDMYLHVDTGDRIIGVGGYAADRFELVQDESEHLTPEQVLQYFKEGREGELEYFNPLRSAWKPYNDMGVYMINDLFNSHWRVRAVPKTIDYYGTELPKPIDISKLDGSTVVYVPQLHRGTVNPITVDRAKKYHFYKDALHFSTESDAKLVLDTILKPFKQ